MRTRNHINVQYVITAAYGKVFWKITLKEFMKSKSYINVCFVIIAIYFEYSDNVVLIRVTHQKERRWKIGFNTNDLVREY